MSGPLGQARARRAPPAAATVGPRSSPRSLGDNKNAVIRALHLLRDEGLLGLRRGRGPACHASDGATNRCPGGLERDEVDRLGRPRLFDDDAARWRNLRRNPLRLGDPPGIAGEWHRRCGDLRPSPGAPLAPRNIPVASGAAASKARVGPRRDGGLRGTVRRAPRRFFVPACRELPGSGRRDICASRRENWQVVTLFRPPPSSRMRGLSPGRAAGWSPSVPT